LKLSSVNGESITVVGQLIVNVSFLKNEIMKLPLIIVTEGCVKKVNFGSFVVKLIVFRMEKYF